MLYADKQALETDLKVCLLAIRERELDFYTQNCRSIGTSAALLAGFAYAGLSSTSDFSEDTTEFSKGVFLTVTVCAMSLNIASMAAATWCSMLGPGLALRGPDGSMDRAVEGLALEYRVIFLLFAAGLLCFFFSALLLVIDEFEWVLSVVLALLLLGYLRQTWRACTRIYKKFRLPVGQAIAGSFNPDGSRGTAIAGCTKEEAELQVLRSNKRFWQWPRRNFLYAKLFYDEFLGVSESVFQQRYERTTFGRTDWSKAYTYSIHNVIRFLERPDHTPYASDIPSSSRARRQSTERLGRARRPSSEDPRHRTNRVEPVACMGSGVGAGTAHEGRGSSPGSGGDQASVALAAALGAQRRGSPRARRPNPKRGVFSLARRLVAGEQGATLRDAHGLTSRGLRGDMLPGEVTAGGLLDGTHASGVISPAESLHSADHSGDGRGQLRL